MMLSISRPLAVRNRSYAVAVLVTILTAMMLVVQSASAQLRIEITEGMVAPTPIAVADFTGADGRPSDANGQPRKSGFVSITSATCSSYFDPGDLAWPR